MGQQPRKIVVVDRIVAIVNDDVITRLDLDERVRFAYLQLKQQGTPPPPREALEKQILERMVTDRVQLQFAKETGLRVDDGELDKAIQRIAQDNKLTLAQLQATLEKDSVPFASFREDIRNEIILARLREREVDNRISVAESEIESFISAQQAQAGRSDEYNLAHILVTVPEQASPEQIQARRARAEQALAQIRPASTSARSRRAFSDAPDALQGGGHGLARCCTPAHPVRGGAEDHPDRRDRARPAQFQRVSYPAPE